MVPSRPLATHIVHESSSRGYSVRQFCKLQAQLQQHTSPCCSQSGSAYCTNNQLNEEVLCCQGLLVGCHSHLWQLVPSQQLLDSFSQRPCELCPNVVGAVQFQCLYHPLQPHSQIRRQAAWSPDIRHLIGQARAPCMSCRSYNSAGHDESAGGAWPGTITAPGGRANHRRGRGHSRSLLAKNLCGDHFLARSLCTVPRTRSGLSRAPGLPGLLGPKSSSTWLVRGAASSSAIHSSGASGNGQTAVDCC